MHEDIVAAVVVGNKSKPFAVIEPFNSSVHYYTSCGAVTEFLLE